jgi:hypothetical protein
VVARPASEQAAQGAALDLHEGISDPAANGRGCARAAEHLGLVNTATGELVRTRCRASKKCAYCGRLAAVQNAEMVALDACEHAPTAFIVLTTRDPKITAEEVHRGLESASKALRRRWPGFEWACFVEFTTGLSVWSGGHRRIHLNLIGKGIPEDDQARELAREVLLKTWGRRTGTTQLHVGPIYAAEGLVRYVTNLALHVMKDGQKPPPGYAGNLIRWSRGYFADGATAMRDRAIDSLKLKRLLHRGVAPELAELELDVRNGQTWELRRVVDVPAELRWIDTGRAVSA